MKLIYLLSASFIFAVEPPKGKKLIEDIIKNHPFIKEKESDFESVGKLVEANNAKVIPFKNKILGVIIKGEKKFILINDNGKVRMVGKGSTVLDMKIKHIDLRKIVFQNKNGEEVIIYIPSKN